MRVNAGKFKRKSLCAPIGMEITRPTSDRVKENIFNMLQNEFDGKFVLDLFAGSGALGIEALSRGAKKVLFVETNKEALDCIRNNLSSVQAESNSFEIFSTKVTDFLTKQNAQLRNNIEIIFADPPYETDWYHRALVEIENSGLCHPNCMVMLEMSNDTLIAEQKNWICLRSRKYGKTKVEIWRYQVDSQGASS